MSQNVILDGVVIDASFWKEWDQDQIELEDKYCYEPKRHLPKKDRIQRGLSVLPAGALYTAITIADELGSEDAFVIWAKKYPSGDVIVSFKGLCPIHGYHHSSNNWSIIQSAKYQDLATLKCFHDGTKRKILPIPSLITHPTMTSWINNYNADNTPSDLQERWTVKPICLEHNGDDY